jgi:hypothetical protein
MKMGDKRMRPFIFLPLSNVIPLLLVLLFAGCGGSGDAVPMAELMLSVEGAGSVERTPSGDRYVPGTEIRLTPRPQEGWRFREWRGDHQGTDPELILQMDHDRVLTAVFTPETPPTYTLTVEDVYGWLEMTPSGGVYPAGTVVTVEAQPFYGTRFVEWTGDIHSTENPVDIVMDDDKVIVAHYEKAPKLPPDYWYGD